MSDAAPTDASKLCGACGLCCDGTLFHHVELEDEEVIAPSIRVRLRMVDERSFLQPCSQRLELGCAVYEDRPRRCREYRCTQLERLADDHNLQAALTRVAAVRAVADRIRARLQDEERREWLIEGLAKMFARPGTELTPELALDMAELGVRMKRDFGKKI